MIDCNWSTRPVIIRATCGCSIVGCFPELWFSVYRDAGACGVANAIHKQFCFSHLGLCWACAAGFNDNNNNNNDVERVFSVHFTRNNVRIITRFFIICPLPLTSIKKMWSLRLWWQKITSFLFSRFIEVTQNKIWTVIERELSYYNFIVVCYANEELY